MDVHAAILPTSGGPEIITLLPPTSDSQSYYGAAQYPTEISANGVRFSFNRAYSSRDSSVNIARSALSGHISSLAAGGHSCVLIAGEGDDIATKQPLAEDIVATAAEEIFQLIDQARESFPDEPVDWSLRISCFSVGAESDEVISDGLATCAGAGSAAIPNSGPFSPGGRFNSAVVTPRGASNGGALLTPGRSRPGDASGFNYDTSHAGYGSQSFIDLGLGRHGQAGPAASSAAVTAAAAVASAGLALRDDPHFGAMTVPGLWEVECESAGDVRDVCTAVDQAFASVAAASLAAVALGRPPRYHVVTQLTLHQKRTVIAPDEQTGEDTEVSADVLSRLSVVRLARASAPPSPPPASMAQAEARAAAQAAATQQQPSIPPWVVALANVLSAVEQRAPRVPFASSKATMLLRDALCGKIPSVFLVTVPGSASLGLATLQFATRIKAAAAILGQAVSLSPSQLSSRSHRERPSPRSSSSTAAVHTEPKQHFDGKPSVQLQDHDFSGAFEQHASAASDADALLQEIDNQANREASASRALLRTNNGSAAGTFSSSSSASAAAAAASAAAQASLPPSPGTSESAAARALARHLERQKHREVEAAKAKTLLSSAIGAGVNHGGSSASSVASTVSGASRPGLGIVDLNDSVASSIVSHAPMPPAVPSVAGNAAASNRSVTFAPHVSMATYDRPSPEQQRSSQPDTGRSLQYSDRSSNVEEYDEDDVDSLQPGKVQGFPYGRGQAPSPDQHQFVPGANVSSASAGSTPGRSLSRPGAAPDFLEADDDDTAPDGGRPMVVGRIAGSSSSLGQMPADIAAFANVPMRTEPMPPASSSAVGGRAGGLAVTTPFAVTPANAIAVNARNASASVDTRAYNVASPAPGFQPAPASSSANALSKSSFAIPLASPTGRSGADLERFSADIVDTSRKLFGATLSALQKSQSELMALKNRMEVLQKEKAESDARAQDAADKQHAAEADAEAQRQQAMTVSQLNASADSNLQQRAAAKPLLPRQNATSIARARLAASKTGSQRSISSGPGGAPPLPSGGAIVGGGSRVSRDDSPGRNSTGTIEAELNDRDDDSVVGGDDNGSARRGEQQQRRRRDLEAVPGAQLAQLQEELSTLKTDNMRLLNDNKALAKAAKDYEMYKEVVESSISRLQFDVQRVAIERDESLKQCKALQAAMAKERIAAKMVKQQMAELQFIIDGLNRHVNEKDDAIRMVNDLREALRRARANSSTAEASLSVLKEVVGSEVDTLKRQLSETEGNLLAESRKSRALEGELAAARSQLSSLLADQARSVADAAAASQADAEAAAIAKQQQRQQQQQQWQADRDRTDGDDEDYTSINDGVGDDVDVDHMASAQRMTGSELHSNAVAHHHESGSWGVSSRIPPSASTSASRPPPKAAAPITLVPGARRNSLTGMMQQREWVPGSTIGHRSTHAAMPPPPAPLGSGSSRSASAGRRQAPASSASGPAQARQSAGTSGESAYLSVLQKQAKVVGYGAKNAARHASSPSPARVGPGSLPMAEAVALQIAASTRPSDTAFQAAAVSNVMATTSLGSSEAVNGVGRSASAGRTRQILASPEAVGYPSHASSGESDGRHASNGLGRPPLPAATNVVQVDIPAGGIHQQQRGRAGSRGRSVSFGDSSVAGSTNNSTFNASMDSAELIAQTYNLAQKVTAAVTKTVGEAQAGSAPHGSTAGRQTGQVAGAAWPPVRPVTAQQQGR